MGEAYSSDELLQDYEKRAKELDDEDYKKVEANPVDVKDIQNTKEGIHGFWLRAMLFHPLIARLVTEKDRPILNHLQDVTCALHDASSQDGSATAGYGFDLVFKFEKNDYFNNE